MKSPVASLCPPCSQLETFPVEIVERVKLSLAFLLGAHLLDFLSVSNDHLPFDGAIRLVGLLAVADVRLVVSVDVLHHELVVI